MNREIIVNVLRRLYFVNWDRYFNIGHYFTFFGWIKREDSYKDFVVIDFYFGEDGKTEISYSRSSKKYSKQISGILNCSHSDCRRVEHFCDIDNVIKEDDKCK